MSVTVQRPTPAPAPPPADRPHGPTPATTRARVAALLRGPGVIAWGLAAGFAALYLCVAVNRNRRGLGKAYDLGIFEQAVRAYAHGRAPIVPLKGPGYHLLGDHFHPLLAVLAPFYRVFPGPLTLVTAQALLMALAVVPLARWAHEVGGARLAVLVGVRRGRPGGSSGQWRTTSTRSRSPFRCWPSQRPRWAAMRPLAAALWALPLLLVKEDLGLTVAAFGLLIAWRARRERRTPVPGLVLAGVGVARPR